MTHDLGCVEKWGWFLRGVEPHLDAFLQRLKGLFLWSHNEGFPEVP